MPIIGILRAILAPNFATRSSSTLSKKPRSCIKQGNVSAADRVAELGSTFSTLTAANFFAGLAILVDHFRKDSVGKHVNSNVSLVCWYFIYTLYEPIKQA